MACAACRLDHVIFDSSVGCRCRLTAYWTPSDTLVDLLYAFSASIALPIEKSSHGNASRTRAAVQEDVCQTPSCASLTLGKLPCVEVCTIKCLQRRFRYIGNSLDLPVSEEMRNRALHSFLPPSVTWSHVGNNYASHHVAGLPKTPQSRVILPDVTASRAKLSSVGLIAHPSKAAARAPGGFFFFGPQSLTRLHAKKITLAQGFSKAVNVELHPLLDPDRVSV